MVQKFGGIPVITGQTRFVLLQVSVTSLLLAVVYQIFLPTNTGDKAVP